MAGLLPSVVRYHIHSPATQVQVDVGPSQTPLLYGGSVSASTAYSAPRSPLVPTWSRRNVLRPPSRRYVTGKLKPVQPYDPVGNRSHGLNSATTRPSMV